MYSMKDLRAEIAAKVDNLRSLGASDSELNPDWIAQNILNDHPDDGVDEFTVCAAGAAVRKEVRRYLNKLTPEDEELELTELEALEAKLESTELGIEELEAMAEGCSKHAEELRRYLAARRAARRSLPLNDERAGEDSP